MHQRDMKDIVGGLGLTSLGVFAAVYAQRYEFGDLNRMGPGYFPVALGILLALLGLMIALPAFFRAGPAIKVNWKAYGLIMLSLVAFAFTLKTLGLVAATLLSVVLSTLPDNDTSWKSRGMIALGVALVTYLVFGFGLRMLLPIWPWSA